MFRTFLYVEVSDIVAEDSVDTSIQAVQTPQLPLILSTLRIAFLDGSHVPVGPIHVDRSFNHLVAIAILLVVQRYMEQTFGQRLIVLSSNTISA